DAEDLPSAVAGLEQRRPERSPALPAPGGLMGCLPASQRGGRAVCSARGKSIPVWDCGHAKAHAVAPVRRRAPEAERRPAVGAFDAPAPAPDHPIPAIRRTRRVLLRAFPVVVLPVPVGTPLPDVAVHVVQTKDVRPVRTHWTGSIQVRTLVR